MNTITVSEIDAQTGTWTPIDWFVVFNDALFWHLALRHWSNGVGEWADDDEVDDEPNIA